MGVMTKTSSITEKFMHNFENCSDYFTERGYNNGPVTDDELEFPIAYSCK